MKIISWDVGVVHLAYCVLEYNSNESHECNKYKIIDWNTINLIDEQRLNLKCIGLSKNGTCDKQASTYICINKKNRILRNTFISIV